jgi:8-oxo-dGTP diphosphatase
MTNLEMVEKFKTTVKDLVSSFDLSFKWLDYFIGEMQKKIKWYQNRCLVGVGIVLKQNNKILLLKRKSALGCGTWSVPGGWVDPGEQPEKTAIREAMEEVGLKVYFPGLFGCTNYYHEKDGISTVTLWYYCEFEGIPFNKEPEKASEMMWADLDNLPTPLYGHLEKMIPHIKGLP